MGLPFFPQPKGPSRLAMKMMKASSDTKQIDQWRRAVYQRDGYKCRMCGKSVNRGLGALDKQAHPHHIVGRAVKETRYDVRNGLTLDAGCHELVTGVVNERWLIVGTKFFKTVDGRQRIDAGTTTPIPVLFKRIA